MLRALKRSPDASGFERSAIFAFDSERRSDDGGLEAGGVVTQEVLQTALEVKGIEAPVISSAATGSVIQGYATRFDKLFVHPDLYLARFAKGAFSEWLKGRPNVFLLKDHSKDCCYAGTTDGSLELLEDDLGVAFRASIGGDSSADGNGAALAENISTGGWDGCSISFVTLESRSDYIAGREVTTITKAELSEVSIVDRPAVYTTAVIILPDELRATPLATWSEALVARETDRRAKREAEHAWSEVWAFRAELNERPRWKW